MKDWRVAALAELQGVEGETKKNVTLFKELFKDCEKYFFAYEMESMEPLSNSVQAKVSGDVFFDELCLVTFASGEDFDVAVRHIKEDHDWKNYCAVNFLCEAHEKVISIVLVHPDEREEGEAAHIAAVFLTQLHLLNAIQNVKSKLRASEIFSGCQDKDAAERVH